VSGKQISPLLKMLAEERVSPHIEKKDTNKILPVFGEKGIPSLYSRRYEPAVFSILNSRLIAPALRSHFRRKRCQYIRFTMSSAEAKTVAHFSGCLVQKNGVFIKNERAT
jgi:hypothetical protein